MFNSGSYAFYLIAPPSAGVIMSPFLAALKLDWRMFWLLGLLAASCLPLLSPLGLRDSWYFLIACSSAGVIWLGIGQQGPRPIQPWRQFAIAISAQCLGGLIEANTDVSGAFGMHLSLADMCLLSGHLAMMSSLWQLACYQQPQFPRHGFFSRLDTGHQPNADWLAVPVFTHHSASRLFVRPTTDLSHAIPLPLIYRNRHAAMALDQ